MMMLSSSRDDSYASPGTWKHYEPRTTLIHFQAHTYVVVSIFISALFLCHSSSPCTQMGPNPECGVDYQKLTLAGMESYFYSL